MPADSWLMSSKSADDGFTRDADAALLALGAHSRASDVRDFLDSTSGRWTRRLLSATPAVVSRLVLGRIPDRRLLGRVGAGVVAPTLGNFAVRGFGEYSMSHGAHLRDAGGGDDILADLIRRYPEYEERFTRLHRDGRLGELIRDGRYSNPLRNAVFGTASDFPGIGFYALAGDVGMSTVMRPRRTWEAIRQAAGGSPARGAASWWNNVVKHNVPASNSAAEDARKVVDMTSRAARSVCSTTARVGRAAGRGCVTTAKKVPDVFKNVAKFIASRGRRM